MAWLLGLSWGVLLALPLVQRARGVALHTRVDALRAAAARPEPASSRRGAVLPRIDPVVASVVSRARRVAAPVTTVLGPFAARRRDRDRDAALARELPVVIDLLGVAVAAGCTPYLAVDVAARWGPARVAACCDDVMRSCALGVGFDEALDEVARANPLLRPLVDALLASDRLGAPVGPQLARLAAEERAALRRRAEAHARRVPVKLLFPLVFLVLPAFVLLTVVPGLAAGLRRL